MKRVIVAVLLLCFIAESSFSKDVLPIPVKYNPFKRAKRLILKKENIVVKKKKKKIVKRKKVKRRVEKLPILAGIFNNKAFMNGKLYAIGEKVNGYRITAIKNDQVYLKKYGKQIALSLIKRRGTVYKKEEQK
jgi:hypothetical protein